MVDLGAIGFGLPPDERLKEQSAYIAQAALPFLREGLKTAREGRVTWDPGAMELIFSAIDEMAPLIDDPHRADFDEAEKLLLHSVFSAILNMRKLGTLNERKMKMIAAVVDVFVELYSTAAQIVGLEVDRSGE